MSEAYKLAAHAVWHELDGRSVFDGIDDETQAEIRREITDHIKKHFPSEPTQPDSGTREAVEAGFAQAINHLCKGMSDHFVIDAETYTKLIDAAVKALSAQSAKGETE